jgi:undecaprenyl diphosphate synthase
MHIAIIMDGNGRWALRKRLPRTFGHRAGADAVNKVVEAAARRRIGTLTLYAFSQANWQRPTAEVSGLFALFKRHLQTQTSRCIEQSIRLNVIGRRDRLSPDLVALIESSERATAHGTGMRLRIAVDYSAQHSLIEVCRRARPGADLDRSRFLERLAEVDHSTSSTPEVDLLIRTGGEQRLSDFLLWECAYAELLFTKRMWPDFARVDLEEAVEEYYSRERRFGRIPEAAAG